MAQHNLLAQVEYDLGGTEKVPLKGIGPLGDTSNLNENWAAGTFTKVISNIIGIFSVIAIIWFVILLFSGAIKLMMASGDKTKVQNAQKQITNGLIGLVIVLLGIFLIDLVGRLLGIPNILSIGSFILKLNPLKL